MIQEFTLEDYLKMQNEMYLSGMKGIPNTEVTCYGDEKQKIILHVWYDEIDVPLVERCKSNLFIKAYSENGREGVQTQTSPKIVFTDLGYGRDSTASLRRLIALYAKGWTSILEDKQLEIFAKE